MRERGKITTTSIVIVKAVEEGQTVMFATVNDEIPWRLKEVIEASDFEINVEKVNGGFRISKK